MFNKKILSTAIAMTVALGSTHVFAAESEAVEEIVVSGIRESLSKALDLKRSSNQVTDSIVAEDIGKLPDNSVAAALQRVTGVQITRVNGEASKVMIRGLPNVVTTLNGRDIFTSTGRGIALADIPADLLERVDVKKSPSASDIEGGIAGLVDVRLRRPFDFDQGFTVAGGVRAEYAEMADKTNPIGSLTVNDRWETGAGEFGVMASVSIQNRQFSDDNRTFVVAPTAVTLTDPRSAALNVAGQPSLIPGVTGAIYSNGDRNRTSENLAFQWKPSDTAEYYAEFFHVAYDQDSELNFWVPLPSWGGINGYVTEYKKGTNVAKTFVRDNTPGTISSNQAFGNTSDTTQTAFGGKWTFDNFTVKSDLAYTKSDAHNRGFILDTAFFANKVVYEYSKDGSGAADTAFYNADGSAYDLGKASNYELWQYFDNRSVQDGKEIAWSTDVNYQLSDAGFTSVDAGLRISQRDAFNQSADTGARFRQGSTIKTMADYDGMAVWTNNTLLDGVANLNTKRWLTPSRDYIYENRAQIRTDLGYSSADPDYDPAKYFDDQENNYAVYAKANFNTEIAGHDLKGEVGGRYVRLESTLQGNSISYDASSVKTVTSISSDTSEQEFLPSVSARLSLTDKLSLLGSVSKTLYRPDFAQMNPATSYFEAGATNSEYHGDGGNPNLHSVKSDNADLSLEWYFANDSSLTGALFHRSINGYIQTYGAKEIKGAHEYTVSRPQNTGDGSMDGIEVAYTQFFSSLPGAFAGLGIQLNGTYIDAEAESPVTKKMEPLVNVSKNSYNAILIYEWNGLSSRLAYNWRSSYYDSFNAGGAQPGQSVIFDPTSSLDFSISYEINDNLTITADGVNLTETHIENYFGGDSSADKYLYPRDVGLTETTYSLGLRFKY